MQKQAFYCTLALLADMNSHVTTALLYRHDAEARMEPIVTKPELPIPSRLPAYPTSFGYSPRRRHQLHIEVIERTYVVVEDSLPEAPARAVSGKLPRGSKK